MRKAVIMLFAALVLAAGAAGTVFASGQEEGGGSAEKPETMVCTYAQMANDFFITFDKGAKEAVEALGNNYIAAPDERRPEKFMSNLNTFAASGVRMIFGYPPSIGSVIEASKFVNREKVYYANILEIADWWTPLDAGPYWGQFVGPNAYVDGYLGGLEMGKLLNGKGNTCILLGFAGSKAGNDRVRGYKAAIKDNFPGITFLAEEYGDFVRDKGYALTQDWITQFGEKIDGVFGANTSMSVGSAAAFEEAGFKKHVVQVTTDANASNMPDLKNGSLDAVFNIYGYWMSGRQAVTCWDLAHGWKPELPERMLSTMQSPITRENVDWYLKTFCEDRKYDFDWLKMSRVLHPDDWDPQGFLVPIYPENFSNWRYLPKPAGYSVPKEYKEAMDSGEFKRITEMYREKFMNGNGAWVIPPPESAPYNYVFAANDHNADFMQVDMIRRTAGDKLVYETMKIPYHDEIGVSGENK